MSTGLEALVDLVASLSLTSPADARQGLESARPEEDGHDALGVLTNLVRQAPATHTDRTVLLARLATIGPDLPVAQLLTASHLLRTGVPRFPAARTGVTMPPLDGPVTAALKTVFVLDREVPEPWTLVGGLMVMLHCIEHGVLFTRATADADLAVGVFTHREALYAVTRALTELHFTDVTPDPLDGGPPLSYRWTSEDSRIDLMVPDGVNEQGTVPRAVNSRPSVELPATQQALARSERIRVSLADGTVGTVRRPDLLGALVIKAVAAVRDNREPERHLGDVVALCEAIAYSGSHTIYVRQLRPKDVARLRAVSGRLTQADWRRANDPDSARGALEYLLAEQAL